MKTNMLSRSGLFLSLQILVLTGIAAIVASSQAPGTVRFEFSVYGNPQRPFPGYVGPWQLGPVWLSGSGVVRLSDGALLSGGQLSHSDDLRDQRWPNHRTQWRVVRGEGYQDTDGRKVLRLRVQVSGSNYQQICPTGTYGIIDLVDDETPLTNRYSNDSLSMTSPNPASYVGGRLACGTHTHGFNNQDYSWTEPARGGAGGGIWANVRILGAARQRLQILNVAYPRRIRGDGKRHDITVNWRGDATLPVKLVLAPRTCPAGLNCTTEVQSFNLSRSPIIGRGMVWCRLTRPMIYDWDYVAYLEDAAGARSNTVAIPGRCSL